MGRKSITNEEYKKRILSIMDSRELTSSQIQKLTKIQYKKLMVLISELVNEKKIIRSEPSKRITFHLEAVLPKTSEKEETHQEIQPTENIKKEDTDLKNSLESPQTQIEEKENGTQPSTTI